MSDSTSQHFKINCNLVDVDNVSNMSIHPFRQIKLLDADGNPVTVETADCADCVKERTPEEDLVPIIVGAAAGAAVLLILVILGRTGSLKSF